MPALPNATDVALNGSWLRDLWAYARQQATSPAGLLAQLQAGVDLPRTDIGYLPTDYLQAVPTVRQAWCQEQFTAATLVQAVLVDGHVSGLERWVPTTTTADAEALAAASTLHLVTDGDDHGRCWCVAGPLRIGIDSPASGSVRQVVVRRGDRVQRDRFDLTVGAQTRRFASNAAARCGVSAALVEAHIHTAWALVRDQEAAQEHPTALPVAEAERADAEQYLRDPDLLTRISQDLTALGWIGDAPTQQLLYLTAISRFLSSPIWGVYQASAGAAPWRDLSVLAALIPPEDCLVFHRITESVLRQTDNRALRNRVILIDRAETLRPEAALALRILHERGAIGWQGLSGIPVSGNPIPPGIPGNGNPGNGTPGTPVHPGNRGNPESPWFSEVRGPVAVIAAATGPIDSRCRECLLPIAADDSPSQTARILDAQRHARNGSHDAAHRERLVAIQRLHHAIQRTVTRDPVCIPFSGRIAFPVTSPRYRSEHSVFLSVIEASALLHQFQRERDASGTILADERDFAVAAACTGHLLGQDSGGLSRASRTLLSALPEDKAACTMRDLVELLPDWTRHAYRSALAEAVDLGYVEASPGGRGRERTYRLTEHALRVSRIALLPPGATPVTPWVGGLVTVGERVSPTPMPISKVG